VDRHEGFLYQVFSLRWTVTDACKSMFEVAAQMTAQPLKKRPMSRSITIEAGYHQRSELVFVGMSGFVHWLIREHSTAQTLLLEARHLGPSSRKRGEGALE
jgi:hypothetical protein